MSGTALTIKHGHAADFSHMGRPLSWYQNLAQHSDVTVVIIDMMSKGWAQDCHYALQAGLGVTLFQGYLSSAFAKPAEARLRARMMVGAVQSVGLAKHTDVFLDWESVPSSVSTQAAIQWIDSWLNEVDTSGAQAGIYEGPDQPLTAQDFATHFPKAKRWKSLSTVPLVASGYVMTQTHGNVRHKGYQVDWDVIQPDTQGRDLVVTQAGPTPVSQPATPAPSAVDPTTRQTIARLSHRVTALDGLAADLRKALDRFPPPGP